MIGKLHVYAAQFAYDAKDWIWRPQELEASAAAGEQGCRRAAAAGPDLFSGKAGKGGLAALKSVIEHARRRGKG
jgi:hypothetical protein